MRRRGTAALQRRITRLEGRDPSRPPVGGGPEPWSGWLETVAKVGTGLALGVVAIALVGSWLGRRELARAARRARASRDDPPEH